MTDSVSCWYKNGQIHDPAEEHKYYKSNKFPDAGSLSRFIISIQPAWPGDTNKWSSQDYFKIMTLSKHSPAPPAAASHQDPPST